MDEAPFAAYLGKKTTKKRGLFWPRYFAGSDYSARSTLPLRRQRVQTYFLGGVPFSITLTRWTLGAQILLDVLCE